jgi:outer membrane protein TolC
MKYLTINSTQSLLLVSVICFTLSATQLSSPLAAESESSAALSLQQALALATDKDPWLRSSELRQKAMLESSDAIFTLPNPVVSISMANLPVDGFAFDQEPMTQLKAGVTQMFPRGDSVDIQRQQLKKLAQQHPLLRQERIAKTGVIVSALWLDVYRAQETVAMIEQDRALFQQLSEIVQAGYSSAVGKARQQDIVHAQLELSRLEDRLTKLRMQKDKASGQLSQWLSAATQQQAFSPFEVSDLQVSSKQPSVENIPNTARTALNTNDRQALAQMLSVHPALLAIQQRIEASKSSVELAQEQQKPQWGVNASYAYRADDQLGRSRADFLSIGVSFDVPLFSQTRQDSLVSAAVQETEAIKTDKLLVLRDLLSQAQIAWSTQQRLMQREALFDDKILKQTKEQAEASLTAYTNDDGDFVEVVRARIDDLNARIDALNIQIELLKTQAQLNYLFVTQNKQDGFSSKPASVFVVKTAAVKEAAK